MTQDWDEFSKSLAEAIPRRESLRRFGALLAGAVLAPLGMAATASAAKSDSCRTFCNRCPKEQRFQCVEACRACSGDTRRLCGGCGSYTCCNKGAACCGDYCADLDNDVDNCGDCGQICDEAGPYERAACISGECVYGCVAGAIVCNGICTDLNSDPANCGACGYVCPAGTVCLNGSCVVLQCNFPFIPCGGVCVDPTSDRHNCGGCGAQCADDEACISGFCASG